MKLVLQKKFRLVNSANPDTHLEQPYCPVVFCEFYRDQHNEVYMTREQIGRSLGYAFPKEAIAKLHERHKERLDQFSGVVKLTTPAGGTQETFLYSEKGIYELMRRSEQPLADRFFDFVWETMINIRKMQAVPAPVRASRRAANFAAFASQYQGVGIQPNTSYDLWDMLQAYKAWPKTHKHSLYRSSALKKDLCTYLPHARLEVISDFRVQFTL